MLELFIQAGQENFLSEDTYTGRWRKSVHKRNKSRRAAHLGLHHCARAWPCSFAFGC